jgi:hypothetical protein
MSDKNKMAANFEKAGGIIADEKSILKQFYRNEWETDHVTKQVEG